MKRERRLVRARSAFTVVLTAVFLLGSVARAGVVVTRATDHQMHQLIRIQAEEAASSTSATGGEVPAASQHAQVRFLTIGLPAALIGGLIDGINPSAFATLVFLISYLSTLHRTGREIIVVESVFCAGFFLAYLGIGIGLSELLLKLEFLPKVATAINWAMIVLAFALGTLSLLDFCRALRGRAKEVLLKIPSPMRRTLDFLTANRLWLSHMAPAAFGLGLVLAAVEFVSSGQSYLPLIQFMNSVSAGRPQALCLLLAYNAASVLPLVVIFLLAYRGAGAEKLNGLMRRQNPLTKLAVTVFFFGVGVALIVFS